MHGRPRALTCASVVLILAGCQGNGAADDVVGGDTSSETVDSSGDGDGSETGEPEVCDVPSPYMGGWDIGCCQDDVAPQNGWTLGAIGVGTIMPDYTFTDQFGEAIRLYDFCHDAVWFEYVALW